MFSFVNLLLTQSFLMSDYVTIIGKLLFIVFLGAAIGLLVIFFHYMCENLGILKYISELAAIGFILFAIFGFIITGLAVIMWPCFLFAAILKTFLVNYLSGDLLLNMLSLFLSVFMLGYLTITIIDKGGKNINDYE